MTETWRGIMPIVVTPFTDSYSIDEAALQELVAFSIEAGATGLVGPANASEFSTLSDDERRRWIEIVVAAADGRVPVVASITSGPRRAGRGSRSVCSSYGSRRDHVHAAARIAR